MSARAEPWVGELELQLSAAAVHVAARLRVRRRTHRIAALAVAATLVVGGAALAKTTPFHPISAFQHLIGAQRETQPGDAVSREIRSALVHSGLGVDVDEARLMATLPDGSSLYATPAANGELCLSLSDGGTACGPKIGPGVPIMWLASGWSGSGTLVTGLARDDVRSIAINRGGETDVVAVRNNAFWHIYPVGWKVPSSFEIELTDGTRVTYSTGVAP